MLGCRRVRRGCLGSGFAAEHFQMFQRSQRLPSSELAHCSHQNQRRRRGTAVILASRSLCQFSSSTKSGQVQVLSFETANCWLDPPAQPHTQGCTVGAVHVAGIDTANIPLTFVRSNRENPPPKTPEPSFSRAAAILAAPCTPREALVVHTHCFTAAACCRCGVPDCITRTRVCTRDLSSL